MKKGILFLLVVLIIVALLGCGGKSGATGGSGRGATELVKMKFASCQTNNYALVEQDKVWISYVHDLLPGEIEIEHFAAGELIKQNEVFDSVSDGTVQLGGDFPGYWAGKDTAFNLVSSFPMLMNCYDYINWLEFGGGQDEYDRVYGAFGIVPLPHGPITVESGPRSNKPIKTLADYNGLKLRMSGKSQGNILKKIGAAQVSIASAEVYQGLQRGLLDAAESCTPFLDWGLGYGEVTKFAGHPGWHQPGSMCCVLVNKKIWDSLSDHQKSAFKIAAKATITWTLAFEDYTSAWGTNLFASMGVKPDVLPEADLKKLAEYAFEELYAEAAANPSFARMALSQVEYMHYYQAWRPYAQPFGHGWKDQPLPDPEKIRPHVKGDYTPAGTRYVEAYLDKSGSAAARK